MKLPKAPKKFTKPELWEHIESGELNIIYSEYKFEFYSNENKWVGSEFGFPMNDSLMLSERIKETRKPSESWQFISTIK